MKKNTLIFFLFFLFTFSTLLSAIETPWLHTEGRYIKDPEGNEVILRGLNFVSIWVSAQRIGPRVSYYPHPEESDEGKANLKGLIDLATDGSKGWHTTVLRLPVYPWNVDTDPGWIEGTPAERERYKELLDCAVQYAASKGIYVIIDWHYVHHYGDKLDECLTFWDYAVNRYKHMSNVMFELYNEPIAFEQTHVPDEPDYDWKPWKDTIAQPLVDRIRNHHNAKNLILVGGPRWSQLLGGAYDDPVVGENIVYVCHIYPYHFENQGGGADPGDLSPYVGKTIDKYPVFFTEWGFQDGGNIPCDAIDEDYYAAGMKQYLVDRRTSWCAWVFDPWWEPVMFDPWDYKTLKGSSLPETGGYMGQMVNDFLTEYKDSDLPGGSTSTNKNPVIKITSPSNGDVYIPGETVQFTAHASDPDGSIVSVVYILNGQRLPAGQTSLIIEKGTYTLEAEATDNDGLKTLSAGISFTGKPDVQEKLSALWEGNIWNSGFSGNIVITNNSNQAVNGWQAVIILGSGEKMTNSWNAVSTVSGNTLTFKNLTWNSIIQPGQSVSFGLQGTHSGNFEFPGITATAK